MITDHRRAQFYPRNLPLHQDNSPSTLAQPWYTLTERAIRIFYFCVSRISSQATTFIAPQLAPPPSCLAQDTGKIYHCTLALE